MINEYPYYFARFYDLIYENLRDSTDGQYFLNEIQKTRGKILEVGVGTGRFFTKALNLEADIYGIDVSKYMVEVLKEKISKEEHHRVTVQNIINFQLEEKFQLIIAPFRVFMHILDKEEQIQALNHIFTYLEPGGRFIFDTFVPDLNMLLDGISNQKDFDEEYMPGKRLQRFVSTKPNLVNQLIHVTFTMKWEEDDGYQLRKWDVPLRFFFRYELEHLVERSSFGNHYQILGDFNGKPLDSDSKEFIMVCHKPQTPP